jgi:menaquinone-dependent protoporphyrinogen oxidase
MGNSVLLAYASKYGSTKEIAEKIGEVFKQEGIAVDIIPAQQVKDLSGYKDVIIGVAIYMGMWRKEAKNLIMKNEAALAERRVWIFSTGPSGKGDPIQLVKGVTVPQGMKQVIDRIKPRDIAVFHGKLDPEKMGGMEKFIVKRVGGETGDFRDWALINAWAKKTAAEIIK